VRLARAVGFQQLATLDVITGGRLIVGVGPGYRAVENHTLQVDPRTRVSRLPTRARESVIPHVR
jgi:alkanesulfonate monooxygenase SsuD/methylene tetrahydromethanopterin reductase-like flavin-dependent oxidoreductase (luciferase family)